MFRRSMLFGLIALPFAGIMSKAETASNKSITWTVPKNVKRIRVRAWDKSGNEVIDTNLNVNPDQVFKIDVLD